MLTFYIVNIWIIPNILFVSLCNVFCAFPITGGQEVHSPIVVLKWFKVPSFFTYFRSMRYRHLQFFLPQMSFFNVFGILIVVSLPSLLPCSFWYPECTPNHCHMALGPTSSNMLSAIVHSQFRYSRPLAQEWAEFLAAAPPSSHAHSRLPSTPIIFRGGAVVQSCGFPCWLKDMGGRALASFVVSVWAQLGVFFTRL